MTPQAAASMITAALPATTTPDDVEKLTDYQWTQLAESAGIVAPSTARVAVGPDTRRHVAALLKARVTEAGLDPFRGLPV